MRHIRPILEEHIMGAKLGNQDGGAWASTLDAEQRAACKAIMDPHGRARTQGGYAGWSVFMIPTTGRPYYLELRYHATLEHGAFGRTGHGPLLDTNHEPPATIPGPAVKRWIITDERPRQGIQLDRGESEHTFAPDDVCAPPNEKGAAPLGSDPSPFTAVASTQSNHGPGGND